MNYSLGMTPETVNLALSGRFTFAETAGFNRIIARALSHGHCKEIRLDLATVEDADSSALASLMKAHDAAKRRSLAMIFVGAHGRLRALLDEAALYNPLNLAAA